MTLFDLLAGGADHSEPAVIDGAGEISHPDLFDRAARLAAELTAAVPSGARVGVIATADVQGVVDLLAALLSHRPAAMLPLDGPAGQDPRSTAAAANAAVILHQGNLTAVGQNPDPLLDSSFGLTAGSSLERVVLFTSGTTNLPRGVRLSEANLLANLTAMLRLAVPWQAGDRVGQILTLAHSFGLSMALLALIKRVPLVMLPDGPPSRRLAETITDSGVTVFACVPYFLRLMATRGIDLWGDTAPALRHLYLAGGGISDQELAALLPRYQGRTYLMYGFTEATARIAVRIDKDGAPSDSVGLPLPGTHVQVVDPAGRPVPAGDVGRIQAFSPSLMLGYLGEPTRTPGAPILTTDLGRLDEAGNLFITGREAEMMNFRGNRVSVVAIEYLVNGINGVLESRLRPDSRAEDAQGELLIVAEVQADHKAIRREVLAVVSPRGLIRQISFIDDLPKTRSGKAIRH